MAHNRPPWKSGTRHELVKSLMSANQEMFQREQLGLVTRSEARAFTAEGVEEFARSAVKFQKSEIDHVFVAIDPAGGGSSCLAIVSAAVLRDGTIVVVAADSFRINTDFDLERDLSSHLAAMREDSMLTHATFVTVIEAGRDRRDR